MANRGDIKWIVLSGMLILFVLVIEIMFVLNGPWVADYWEHRAVLNELTRNISNPSHPIVNSAATHAFFSPYMIVLAAIARFFSVTPLAVLNVVSIFNIGFFLFSIWLLSILFFKQQGVARSFFFLALILLFYWGVLPPYFSSFYHFIAFPYIAAYPSTFSFCCSVLSAFLFDFLLKKKHNSVQFIVIAISIIVLNWVVIITHPLTFLFTISMYLFLSSKSLFNIRENKLREGFRVILTLSLLFFIPFYISFFWPYFPMKDLIGGVLPQHQFHSEGEVLYQSIFRSYFPMLLPLSFLLLDLFKRRWQSIPWALVIVFLFSIYLYGFLTKQFGFGRCASFLVIWLQIYLLNQIMNLKTIFTKRIVVAASFILALPFFMISNKIVLKTAFKNTQSYLDDGKFTKKYSTIYLIKRLEFLNGKFQEGDVVLVEEIIGKYLPAFGAKIIANPYTGYWLTDSEERNKDLKVFFDRNTRTEERSFILEKYRPDYLLVTASTQQLTHELSDYFDIPASIKDGDYYLIKLKYAKNY